MSTGIHGVEQTHESGAGHVIVDSGTVTTTITNDGTFAKETGGNLAAIKTDVDKIPSQGQALAAASMPVVLPALQVTALTPPAAITGFALDSTVAKDSSLTTIDTDIKATQPRSITNFPAIQPISAASLPLPSNAAQEAGGILESIRNYNQIANRLLLQQLLIAQSGAAGFVPVETPSFLV